MDRIADALYVIIEIDIKKGSAALMKSYILGMMVAIVLSAAYAFSNTGEISVSFLSFEYNFPQGIWEVFLFASGALIMWFFSVAASFELYSSNRKKNREMAKRIAELEDEKKSLLTTLQHIGGNAGFHAGVPAKTPETEPDKKTPRADKTPDAAVQTKDNSTPSFLKNLYGSFFAGGEKTESGENRPRALSELPEGEVKNSPDLAERRETAETSDAGVGSGDGDDGKKETFTV
jgi:uncharacterized integral membrane protein